MSHRPGHGQPIVAPRKRTASASQEAPENGAAPVDNEGPPPSVAEADAGSVCVSVAPGVDAGEGERAKPVIRININVNVPVTLGKNPNAQYVAEYLKKIVDAAREAGLL